MRSVLLVPFLFLPLTAGSDVTGKEFDQKPNFVLMVVDDLGIGDIGCYGNDTIRTPNIDRLASDGVKLTQHIAAAPLCTPSRTAFMTGRYAIRSGMVSTGRVRVLLFLGGSGGLAPSETTFAKRLQQQGYTTGLVGKWHLGVNCKHRRDHCHHPNQHGFSYFYGLPFTLFNDCVPGEGSDVLVDLQHALQNLTMLLGVGLLTIVCVRVCGLFEVGLWLLVLLFFLCILATAVWYVPFKFLPTWNCIIMRNQEVIEQPMTMETLPQRLLGEAENFIKSYLNFNVRLVTVIGSVYNDNFHIISGKAMGGWEGGIRVPGIFRWPGRLRAGKVVDEPTSLMDLYPTLKYLAKDKQPDRQSDGYNLMPLLEGEVARSEHEFMFHYCGIYLNAVRWHPPGSDSIYKVHFFTPNFFPPGAGGCYDTKICLCHGEHVTHHDPPLLYNLFHDPSESRPLTPDTEPRYAEILEQTAKAVERHKSTLPNEQAPADANSEANTAEQGVELQLTWDKILWRPWLQPCCGTFPFCGCKENTTHM
ncbi:arylsulfatase D [Neolamprologus brichardi]|uniref:arylsulfatase D n=1 Tax=Neolamprologus brichardi TaxID=32507 RepID=UPI0016438D34|nr:arylsulfatase D [Neolamprologus brichardi]